MNFLPAELIKKKRRAKALDRNEIEFLVQGFTSGVIPDYQMAAWLMAVFFNGLNRQETSDLTLEMMRSGTVLNLASIPGIKVDKHSTGGVGDKASLILGPMAAAAGVVVPMIAGRGLGHTGGTLDKLEAIPGFDIHLSLAKFTSQLQSLGISIIGQTAEICPADRKLYALRDVTATVESLPLICGSIMSKKLAEGIDALVMDVKVGSGAFMKTIETAEELARALIAIGTDHGKKVVALITNMDQPLGRFIGNSLEINECLSILRNETYPVDGIDLYSDTRQLSIELAGHMIWLAGIEDSPEQGCQRADLELKSGKALAKFEQLALAQGGSLDKLPEPQVLATVTSEETGFLAGFETEKIGVAAIHMRAGRQKADDAVNPSAGIEIHRKLGQQVRAGDPIFTLYGDRGCDLESAKRLLSASYKISLQKPPYADLILRRLIN